VTTARPVEHHDGVLDKHGVRTIVGGCDFDDLPAVAIERIDVALPLLDRRRRRRPVRGRCGSPAVGEARPGRANQCPHAGRCDDRNAMVLAHAELAAASL
jgi:hypothetical protein